MFYDFLAEVSNKLIVSFRYFQRFLVPAYLGMIIGLGILPPISQIKYGNTLFFFADISTGNGRIGAGAITVFGSMFLVVAGAYFLMVSRMLSLIQAPPIIISKSRWWWLIAGMGIIFVGLDEILMIHEYLTWKMQDMGIPKPMGIDQDIFVFAAYGVAALIIGIKLLPFIRHYGKAIFPLVAMLVFMGASQVIDFIPWDSLTYPQQMVLGPTEEILKTMGEWSLLLYAGLLNEEVVTSHTSAIFQHHKS